MVIGIIGSGISGLIAAKKLAQAGHEVTVVEKSHGLGGRMATLEGGADGSALFDTSILGFEAGTDTFGSFVEEMQDKGLAAEWTKDFGMFDGENLFERDPNHDFEQLYAAPKGMNSIARHLGRWIDFKSDAKAGGITYIGGNRHKKRAWMINLTDISVMEVDAVIIATPAAEAYGILQTAQDETPVRKLIRVIDEINYTPTISLAAHYPEADMPEWAGIQCNDGSLGFISNESSKREGKGVALTIQSSAKFARAHREGETESVAGIMLEHATKVAGNWAGTPDDFPTAENISDDNVLAIENKKYACWRCPLACGGITEVEDGPFACTGHKPEYETLGAFGAMCLNDDLASINLCNDLCNRMGLDTISTGATVAFAMGVERGADVLASRPGELRIAHSG